MTRTVADTAIMFEVIAGLDPADPTTLPDPLQPVLRTLALGVDGLRLGFDRRYASEGVDPEVAEAVSDAVDTLSGLGIDIVDVVVPEAPLEDWGTICSYEAARAHAATYPARADEYGPYFGEFLANGLAVTGTRYDAAMERRATFTAAYWEMLGTVDAIACPSVVTPFPVLDGMGYDSLTAYRQSVAAYTQRFDPPLAHRQIFTAPADFAGTPTISLPCGFSDTGAPLSLQLVGRGLSEAMLCRIAYAYEQATAWHTRHPPI